jgi:hypothetical protein
MSCRYMATYDTVPFLFKLYSSIIWFGVAIIVVLMELRILLGYTVGI